MYNQSLFKRRAQSQKSLEAKQTKLKNWVNRYYRKVRPQLLDRYNKRINSFIRRMEENPQIIHNQQPQETNINKLFRNVYQKQSFIGNATFKFKDADDWKSLLTPAERLERQRDMKTFQEKFGDANLAYRSIGSQSEYNPKLRNQFRVRDKYKQINPPMKYTNKSVMNFTLPGKKREKRKTQPTERPSNKTNLNITHRKSQLELISQNRHRTISSANFLEDDNRSDIASIKNSMLDDEQQENIELLKEKQQQKNDNKMHFKRMIDIEQTAIDDKTKKAVKDLLVKCGVYRNKDKRALHQVERDKLEELI